MGRSLMSTHSIEAFNEADAVTLLKQTLESEHTIKTFFGENDKTPNHDGFFELVDGELTPKKQFIVQIKKTKKLLPNVRGNNKGKYVYEFKTNFLEYVKQKVTESPAIYFVVDIEDKRIFWLYLSDEILMNLNFEGREKISYAFSEENILSDISTFTTILNNIVIQRNKLFLNKTETEIAEMQDAVDYINQLLDHDLKSIKESVFPNLWRLGIKRSDAPGISIGLGNGMEMITCSSAVALYPQTKGKNDSGIREYLMDNDNIFNHLTIGGKVNLSDYSKDTLHKIIISFFENRISAQFLPDIVLCEVIDTFIQKSNKFFGASSCHELSVKEINRRFMLLGKYVQYILSSPSINDIEQFTKQSIMNRIWRGEYSFFDIATFLYSNQLIQSFSDYCNKINDETLVFAPQLFMYISSEYFCYLNTIIELESKRKINPRLPNN